MATTGDVLSRIAANPNPRGNTWRCKFARFVSWGQRHRLIVTSFDKEAAIDSARNVLCVIGAGTVLADFSTMKYWFMLPALGLGFVIWYADYLRHF